MKSATEGDEQRTKEKKGCRVKYIEYRYIYILKSHISDAGIKDNTQNNRLFL